MEFHNAETFCKTHGQVLPELGEIEERQQRPPITFPQKSKNSGIACIQYFGGIAGSEMAHGFAARDDVLGAAEDFLLRC